MKMYYVGKTNTSQRKKVKDDYIVAINNENKKKLKLSNFAIVKYLFSHTTNDGQIEFKEMKVLSRVIVDNNVPVDEIAMDQTLRNAIAIPFNFELKSVKVSIARARFSFLKRITSLFNSGRHVLLRVEKPDVIDIEKDYCRLSEDVIKILQTDIGKRLVLDGLFTNPKKTELINYRKVIDFIKGNPDIPNEITDSFIKLCELKDPELILCKINDNKNLKAISNFILNNEYIVKSLKIEGHSVNESFKTKVEDIRKKNHSDSLNSRYPNALDVFHIENDLMSIHLDSYYRSLLNLDMLDSVRVRRFWFDIFKSEIIDYGLLFIISVFTTVLAVDSDSFSILPFALGFSMFLTVLIIIYRNR